MKRVNKIWGHEIWWADNDKYLAKILFIRRGCSTSFHYHQKKHETLYVFEGEVLMSYGKESQSREKHLSACDRVEIKPGLGHAFYALKDSLLLEASTPYPKDVVRIFEGWGEYQSHWSKENGKWE